MTFLAYARLYSRMSSLPNADNSPDPLLEQARAGCTEALGRLLELYRNYLRLLARLS